VDMLSYTSLAFLLMNIVEDNDIYKEKREKLRALFYQYHDADNCKRIVQFMKL